MHMKHFHPLLWPHPTFGSHKPNSTQHYLRMGLFRTLLLLRKIFLKLYPTYSIIKLWSHSVAPPWSRFERTWICTTWGCFHMKRPCSSFLMIFPIHVYPYVKLIHYWDPTPHPCGKGGAGGGMAWIILNLYTLRKLSHRFCILWPSDSSEKGF